jgi:hypothetical protein
MLTLQKLILKRKSEIIAGEFGRCQPLMLLQVVFDGFSLTAFRSKETPVIDSIEDVVIWFYQVTT